MSESVEYGPDERTSIRESFVHRDDESPSSGQAKWIKPVPKRYILAVMMFLGCCNLYAMRVNLSVAIVAMVANKTINVNGTDVVVKEFDLTPGMQGILLGAFFWGYTVTQIPGGWLSNYFGGKVMYGFGVLSTAVFTVLTPLAALVGGLPLLVVLRILEGLCQGVTYPSIQTLWSKWAPMLERGRLITIAFSGSYAGTMISLPLSGVIAAELGWTWIFYIFGIMALVWSVAWFWIAAESPVDHKTITSEELEYIIESAGVSHMQCKRVPAPWIDIVKSLPFWAIAVAHFVENWGFYTLLTQLPTFLNDIMHFDLSQAGLLAALPYLVMVVFMQTGGHLADCIQTHQWLSTTTIRKLFNCSGFIAQTIFMTMTAYMTAPASAIACLTLAVGFGGLAWAGFAVNPLDIAPQFAGIIWGITNTGASIAGIIAPTVAGYITMNRLFQEWCIVFYLSAGIYCFGALFYGIFASGNLEPWADASENAKKDKRQHPDLDDDDVVEYESGHDELK